MKNLLILLIAACFCLLPVAGLAQNGAPHVNLEAYYFEEDPADPGPVPAYVCVHPTWLDETVCWAPKPGFLLVPLHVSHLNVPLAEALGQTGGGYAGLSYGVVKRAGGGGATFAGFVTCDGWLQLPGTAPAAIAVGSTALCHGWRDHAGYCSYFTTSATKCYFDIVNNADEFWVRVINCQSNYDVNTIIGCPECVPPVSGSVQWGGTKDIACVASPTPVDLTTWGNIKGLYR